MMVYSLQSVKYYTVLYTDIENSKTALLSNSFILWFTVLYITICILYACYLYCFICYKYIPPLSKEFAI